MVHCARQGVHFFDRKGKNSLSFYYTHDVQYNGIWSISLHFPSNRTKKNFIKSLLTLCEHGASIVSYADVRGAGNVSCASVCVCACIHACLHACVHSFVRACMRVCMQCIVYTRGVKSISRVNDKKPCHLPTLLNSLCNWSTVYCRFWAGWIKSCGSGYFTFRSHFIFRGHCCIELYLAH